MGKRWAYYSIAVVAAAGLVFAAAAAQQGSSNQSGMQGHMGMMQGGMGQGNMGMTNGGMGGMRGMMMAGLQNPMGRSTMMTFMLPRMTSELGLSSSQTAQLNGLRQQFTDQEQKTSNRIAEARKDLNAQFNSGKPDENQVKKDVNQIADLQARRLLNGYRTSAKMKALLTPEQRGRLDKMDASGLYNSMMSHMTMDQMGQMMRYMYGAGANGMMSGGMMSGEMMGGGVMSGGMMGGGMMGVMGGTHNGYMRNGMMNGQAAPQRH